jgi:ARG and Rhodanese-Phosphatase-superfamily-associated Protein domain
MKQSQRTLKNIGGICMDTEIAEYFGAMEFGALQQFGAMAVLPVLTDNTEKIEYITLKEAMNKDLLEISEIDESGAVPELKVTNRAEIPVLILDGEELMGAKQNRIVNISILLKEKFETFIPVSCVEQGRWSYTSKNFHDSDHIASYQLRNVKSASVKRSVENSGKYTSDQCAVWDEVHKLQHKMQVISPTSAMGDVYEAKSNDLEEYIKAFKIVDGQKGLLVYINGDIMGLDVVSRKSAYKHLHKKLIKSYALDSMVEGNVNDNVNTNIDRDSAQTFLKEIIQSDESKNESVGYGIDYRFANESYIGSSLVYNNELIHTSFFKSLEDEEIGDMARYRTRVNLRQY